MKKTIVLMFSVLLMTMTAFAQNNENIFVHKVGEYEVILLSEMQQAGSSSILIGATPEMKAATIPEGTFPNAINAFLIKSPTENILVDAGLGIKLIDNLASLNLTPSDIDVILLTHLHGDHIGGMLKEGEAVFSNAKVYLSLHELVYWANEVTNNKSEKHRETLQNVSKFIDAYIKHTQLIDVMKIGEREEVSPDIYAIGAFGHTPGHLMFQLESQGEKLLIWGDLTHAMVIQMPYPEVAVSYDVNPEEAVATRKYVLEYVTKNAIPVAGMHIAYPAMGVVEQNSQEGYQFVPFAEK